MVDIRLICGNYKQLFANRMVMTLIIMSTYGTTRNNLKGRVYYFHFQLERG